LNDWLDLEHLLWKELKEHEILEKKFLVGFSGGVDSLALLQALHRVKPGQVEACFVHHGPGGNAGYRDRAAEYCQAFCQAHKIPFHQQTHQGSELRSEAELREFRHFSLAQIREKTKSDFLALAHHREDLLETRLLRLIRGTGGQGLKAMQALQGALFRPFLKISKNDLQEYLQALSLEAIEDPSNQDLHPMRNWLRQDWLVALEDRQAGAVNALARSLEIIAESLEEMSLPEELFKEDFISRPHYLALSKAQQKQALAAYLLSQKARGFSQSHLEEIQKRLDISKKEFIFRVSGMNWVINAQQIRVEKPE